MDLQKLIDKNNIYYVDNIDNIDNSNINYTVNNLYDDVKDINDIYKNINEIPSPLLYFNADFDNNGFTQSTYAKPLITHSTPQKIFFVTEPGLLNGTDFNINLYGQFFIQTKGVFVKIGRAHV